MKISNVAIIFSAMLCFAGCAKTQTQPAAETSETVQAKQEISSKKALVVYYSISGNTRAVAKQIAKITNADLFEIETKKAYPKEYKQLVKEAKKEINEGFLPELKTMPELDSYKVVFIGSPNWWSTITPAVSSFIKNADLKDKTVIPFFTHGSGGMANCNKDLTAQLEGKGATILDAIAFRGESSGAPEKDLNAWLEGLGWTKAKAANETEAAAKDDSESGKRK